MAYSPGLRHVSNPPNPWRTLDVDWEGMAPPVRMRVIEDHTREILSRNTSPDLPFRWSLNPYRGCYHGCTYCYARPSHQFLDLGAGTDFEQTLIVKPEAPARLRDTFDKARWTGEVILFSGNTDPYQPLEVSYGLTRGCLEVCLNYRNPVSIITKSTLVERDIELLVALDRRARCTVTVSLPFIDPTLSRAIEPHVPSPKRRIETIRRLSEAGLSVRVNVAPVIPGLGDDQIPAILEAARRAGATGANFILLRLPGAVEEVFFSRLERALPHRAERVKAQLRACREGKLNDPRFGHRMSGVGARYAAIEALFSSAARRLGFTPGGDAPHTPTFCRPHEGKQLGLL